MTDRDIQGDGGEDGSRPLVTERYDWSVTRPSLAVVQTLSRIDDDDPFESSDGEVTRLHDYVDPDALDALFCRDETSTESVTLSVEEYVVHVEDNEVAVSRHESS